MYLWFRSATTTGLGAGNTTISDLETNPEDLPRSLQCWSLNNFFVKRNFPRELPPWGILDEDYSWQWCAPCKSNQARIGSLVLEWGVFQLKKKTVGGWKSSWSGELKGTFGVEFLEKHARFFSYSETIGAWSCLTSCTLGWGRSEKSLASWLSRSCSSLSICHQRKT